MRAFLIALLVVIAAPALAQSVDLIPPPASSGGGAPSGAAGGDLGGSYPDPTVTQARGLRETSGPTTLTLGAIADGQRLTRSGSTIIGVAGSTGDVVGPASSTDNAITRFDGTTGKLVQNSTVTVSDTGIVSAVQLTASGFITTTLANQALAATTSAAAPSASFVRLTTVGTAVTAWTPGNTGVPNGANLTVCNVDVSGEIVTLTDGATWEGEGSALDINDCATAVYDSTTGKWRQTSFSNN